MAERQITADGESRPLPDPFLILATQNPLDHEGTFPLPEAQLDRFFLKTTLGYPSLDDEMRIVQAQRHAHPLGAIGTVIDVGALRRIQAAVEDVYIDPIIQRWLIELVRATRMLEIVDVAHSHSSAQRAPGRCSKAARSLIPRTSRRCSSPCWPTVCS
jgi:MoxR-like ATPase